MMDKNATRFTWIPFYEELADKLLEFRHKRKELVDIVYSMDRKFIGFLRDEHDQDYPDIDPFSIFAIFNRGLTNENRKIIANSLRDKFHIKSEIPDDFWGIPVMINKGSTFFWREKINTDIEPLWDLFETVISESDDWKTAFNHVLNQKGIKWNITMALYWIRPKRYLSLDGLSRAYLESAGINVFQEQDLNADNYQKIMDEIKKSNHPKIKGFDFPTLSYRAWTEWNQKKNPLKNVQNLMPNHSETQIDLAVNLLQRHKNIILQGAPGTGKTFNTALIALGLIDENVDFQNHKNFMERYEALQKKGRIFFTTFHQSLDYEDFVEGLKPKVVEDGKGVVYEVTDGIFKWVCDATNDDTRPVVLIIDEINRGNVSKIFGELITLLEKDKRIGGEHPLRVTLPYSGESFGVPSNVYIIGTMNTTDRSTGTLDYALRRRFSFVTLKADKEIIQNPKGRELFEDVERFARDFQTGEIELDDLMIGHSYFMAENDEELKLKIEYEVIPLLKEYTKDGLLRYDKKMKFYFEAWQNLTPHKPEKKEDGGNQ